MLKKWGQKIEVAALIRTSKRLWSFFLDLKFDFTRATRPIRLMWKRAAVPMYRTGTEDLHLRQRKADRPPFSHCTLPNDNDKWCKSEIRPKGVVSVTVFRRRSAMATLLVYAVVRTDYGVNVRKYVSDGYVARNNDQAHTDRSTCMFVTRILWPVFVAFVSFYIVVSACSLFFPPFRFLHFKWQT